MTLKVVPLPILLDIRLFDIKKVKYSDSEEKIIQKFFTIKHIIEI